MYSCLLSRFPSFVDLEHFLNALLLSRGIKSQITLQLKGSWSKVCVYVGGWGGVKHYVKKIGEYFHVLKDGFYNLSQIF